jgi:dethiobiotin synthase
MSARIVLVTGTDTGVGKTVVGCGLGRRLSREGTRVVAVKPVESGCGDGPDEGEDGALLAAATGQSMPAAALVRLRTPVAPPVAAGREGVALDAAAWERGIREFARDADLLLLEGAGGLLSPLTWDVTALDLAANLGAAAILVAPDRLGTLNHTLLTMGVLRTAGVPLLGVVFVSPESPDESTGTNADAFRRVAGPDVAVAVLPRLARIEAAADHLEGVARWFR